MDTNSPLSKELREKYHRRSVTARKDDKVMIVRGEFKGIEGKVTKVIPSTGRLNVEGVNKEKMAGGTAPVPVHASNVVVTEVILSDKKRKKTLEGEA
ncbi:MAG TPA: 50S ribosomal protein L24 [Nitrososphaerales archaeon]|nr:50S ribosomal protein L24 [Nitrososphaerales archaeon]